MLQCTDKNMKPVPFILSLGILVSILALSLVGCRRKAPDQAELPAAVNEPNSAAAIPQSDKVVATIGGVDIKQQEITDQVEQKMTTITEKSQNVETAYLKQRKFEIEQDVTDTRIVEALLDQEAKAQNITATEEEIAQRLTEYPTPAGKDPAEYRERIKQDVIRRKLLAKQYEGKINITDKEAQAYYQKRINDFVSPLKVRASHIQLAANDKDKAQALLTQLKEGADFATLAKGHSQDSLSADKGGDIGFFAQQDMEASFAKAAFSLEAGQLSDVIETSHGLHILKVTDRQVAATKTFENAKAEIVDILTKQHQRIIMLDYIKALREKANL